MFSVIFAMLYGAWEKRIDNKLLVDLLYFLSAGVLWTVLTCLLAFFMVLKDGPVANPVFWRIVPGIGFGLGLVFGFFPWIMGLRNPGDDTEKP
jgi:hypothetical protein